MTFFVIKRTDIDRFVQFKGGSPYWTSDRYRAAVYETEADALIEMRRFGIPYCTAVRR